MESRTTVLVVDDSEDIAQLFSFVISGEADMDCVGELHSADRLLDEVQRKHPSIVLLDLTMPGKPPLEAVRELAAVAPETRVVVFSGHDAAEVVDAALDAGAWGLVSKHSPPQAVLDAIRRVVQGEVCLPGARPG